MLLFGLASLGCALSETPGQLIAARAGLGFSAAFLINLPVVALGLTAIARAQARRC